MTDIEKEILNSHYAQVVDNLKHEAYKRDVFFLLLLISVCVLAVQLADGKFLDSVIIKISGLDSNSLPNKSLLSSFIWVMSLFIFIKYYQICYFIDMKLKYLSIVEEELNKLYLGTDIFTLESKFYKKYNGLPRHFIAFSYRKLAPLFIAIFISFRIYYEVRSDELLSVYFWVDLPIFLTYLFFLFVFAFYKKNT